MKIEMDMPDIGDLHEYTGEYRLPKRGELILSRHGDFIVASGEEIWMHPILRKVQQWRPATLQDLRDDPDEFLEARFRDSAEKAWEYAKLAGADFRRPTIAWIADGLFGCFVICEVKA